MTAEHIVTSVLLLFGIAALCGWLAAAAEDTTFHQDQENPHA